jgi:GMP synthase (glutamine-hydrolysing)
MEEESIFYPSTLQNVFQVEKFLEEAQEYIRKNVAGRAIVACSGGLDSTIVAILSNRAIGSMSTAVFIDTGFIRIGEKERTEAIFRKFGLNFRIIDASSAFIQGLKGVTDPESKRKIIGRIFIEEFENIAREIGAESLMQGTIAPDWIESGGGVRDVIKSHHNVGGLPEKMKLKLVEPLRDLYKDEIREIAKYLGLEFSKQPFPGPGLAVRILGNITEERIAIIKRVTEIVENEVETRLKGSLPWQYFAVLTPVRTTGVHGDKRSYGETIAIRMFETSDAMSGTFSKPPWDFLDHLSTRITNSVTEVNRVVYDITNKPPATIEWE